jgi:fibro-slime domain-containing protein
LYFSTIRRDHRSGFSLYARNDSVEMTGNTINQHSRRQDMLFHFEFRYRSFAAGLIVLFAMSISFGELVIWKTPVTYYDFHGNGSCPEFEKFPGGTDTILHGLVLDTLDANKRPIKNPARGTTDNSSGIYVDNIGKWYRDWTSGADTSFKNIKINDTLDIQSDTVDGVLYCVYSGDFFFPIDGRGFGAEGLLHNYSFTMQMHNRCRYAAGAGIILSSDDDSWLFINNHLAIDNGGPHAILTKSASLDSLNLAPNTIYDFDLFFAERKSTQSTFTLEMGGVELIDKRIVGTTAAGSPMAVSKTGRMVGIGKSGSIMVPERTAKMRLCAFDSRGRISIDRTITDIDAGIDITENSAAGVVFIKAGCFDRGNRPLAIVGARLIR